MLQSNNCTFQYLLACPKHYFTKIGVWFLDLPSLQHPTFPMHQNNYLTNQNQCPHGMSFESTEEKINDRLSTCTFAVLYILQNACKMLNLFVSFQSVLCLFEFPVYLCFLCQTPQALVNSDNPNIQK